MSTITPETEDGWGETRVRRWLAGLASREAQLAPVSDALFARAGLTSGLDVLDVGCGAGPTTLTAAVLVAPGGHVTGVDVAPQMVEAARRRPGADAVTWRVADVQRTDLADAGFDVVLSRFGVMFFDDPAEAFGRLLSATRPGGRLVMAVWRERDDAPFFAVPYAVARDALRAAGATFEEPSPTGGPFTLGNPAVATALLEAAGWTDVVFERRDDPLYLGGPGSSESAGESVIDLGPVRHLLQDQPAEVVDAVRTALVAALEPGHDGTGVALAGGFAIVTATRAVRD